MCSSNKSRWKKDSRHFDWVPHRATESNHSQHQREGGLSCQAWWAQSPATARSAAEASGPRAAWKQTASQLSDTHRQLEPTPRTRQMSTSHDIHDTKYELLKKKKRLNPDESSEVIFHDQRLLQNLLFRCTRCYKSFSSQLLSGELIAQQTWTKALRINKINPQRGHIIFQCPNKEQAGELSGRKMTKALRCLEIRWVMTGYGKAIWCTGCG